jgi:hypothetical protein
MQHQELQQMHEHFLQASCSCTAAVALECMEQPQADIAMVAVSMFRVPRDVDRIKFLGY